MHPHLVDLLGCLHFVAVWEPCNTNQVDDRTGPPAICAVMGRRNASIGERLLSVEQDRDRPLDVAGSAHASDAPGTATAPARRSRMSLIISRSEIADGCCRVMD